MNTNPVKKPLNAITINYHETATNSITDLTGTKWALTAEPDLSSFPVGGTYNINYLCNGNEYTTLYLVEGKRGGYIEYYINEYIIVYEDGVWTNQAYRTVEITGGLDATNPNLISWLQANATQIQEQSNTFSFGNLPIANMYFGTQQVKKVYLGNTLVWEKEEPQPTVDPILANNSWDVIKSVCEAGNAANYWALGDTKTDVGTDGTTRTFRIVDMQGLYGKHVVFEQVGLESTNYRWYQISNNKYSISEMRTTHLPAILAKYSNSLQGVITNTKYKVATNGNNGTLLELEDKLFLPAEREIFSSRSYSRTEEWNALTRFQLYTANDTSAFRKKYKSGATSATTWCLRSPCSGDTGNFCVVSVNGSADYFNAISPFGVSPFFSF